MIIMDKQKKSGISTILYTFGTLMIIVFMAVVAINFLQDGRAFQKPLLSTSVEKKADSTSTEGYKTLKYKKPEADSSKKTTAAKKPTKPAATAKPTVETTAGNQNP